ncbi:sigma-70 family RNA polymerase sigma factor [Zavarzinella formosa]|uniref:sigma-70 family RNA polymerase sigma factor n=1 Tax=Zavarzinella formosa TaxID=360055 RepID=UPI0003133529|nr:sigma-70 family RNA polymerase sigma factor [Zavarzinella formosa]
MSLQASQHLRDYVRRICADAASPSDLLLWNRFVQSNEQDAFEVLVHRHGSMVLACAHRILSDRSEAEDVFQATFLTLARSKNRIRDPQSLTSWLYRTAFRIANKLRGKRRGVRAMPAEAEAVSAAATESDIAWREVRGILDEELQRLPEKIRSPLLLCYLTGLTRDEAAKQLGCSFDQLKRRLEQGRNTLRRRLEHRGIAGAGLALAVLSPELLQATVSPPLVEVCVALVFVRDTVVPQTVAALTLTTTLTKGFIMKTIIASALCISLGVWGYTTTGNSREPQEKTPPPGEPTPEPKTGATPAVDPADNRQADFLQRRRSFKNLQGIVRAIHAYSDTHNFLPADIRDKTGKPLLSWRVVILPYMGDKASEELYRQFKLNEPWDSEHNFKLLAKMPDIYRVGIEPKDSSHTYYQAFAGPGTPLHPMPVSLGLNEDKPAEGGSGGGPGGFGSAPGAGSPPPIRGSGLQGIPAPGIPSGPGGGAPPAGLPAGPGLSPVPGTPPSGAGPKPGEYPRIGLFSITDGTSNTLAVVEAGPSVAWTKPADLPFDPAKPMPKMAGPFSNAIHVAMMDGSACALKRGLDDKLLRILVKMDDGEVIPAATKLHASLPVETAVDRLELKKMTDENQKLIEQFAGLQKEHMRLLELMNRRAADFDAAEEVKDNLKISLEALQNANRALKHDLDANLKNAIPQKAAKK